VYVVQAISRALQYLPTAYQKTTLATYYRLPRLNLRVSALLVEEVPS